MSVHIYLLLIFNCLTCFHHGFGDLLGNMDISKLTSRLFSGSVGPLTNDTTDHGIKNATVLHTVINISRKEPETDNEENDCLESIFMSQSNVVTFAVNGSVGQRKDPKCRWNFFGTERCIPMIFCTQLDLMRANSEGVCEEEYLEVTDGYHGQLRYCGDSAPINVSAADGLRDLYILYKTPKSTKKETGLKLNCTVLCSNPGEALALPKTFKEKVNPKCVCGTKFGDDRIIGGKAADKNEFPWLVALVEVSTRQVFCGGSIINDRMIVTAAHCFNGDFLNVHSFEILVNAHVLDSAPNTLVNKEPFKPKTYNATMLAELDIGNGTQRFQVEEIHVHPLYSQKTNDFDVAVVLLSKSIDFLGSKKKATVAGWGLQSLDSERTPEVLQKVDVQVFSQNNCEEVYPNRVNQRMMCAGYSSGKMDSCSGDSGGPLVLEEQSNKVWYQIGTVSWGDGCARAKSPGVYFRTTESGQWVHFNSNRKSAVWCRDPDTLPSW